MFTPGRENAGSFIGGWKFLGKSNEQSHHDSDDILRVVGNEVDSHKKKLKRRKQALLILLFPLVVLTSYFYLIGRDRYFVRSDIVVRRSNDTTPSQLGGLGALLSQGNQLSLEDARFLRIYLESPQVLDDLEGKIDFKKEYAKKGFDIFSGISPNAPREKTYTLFRKQISTTLDESSGILRIRTLGFAPEVSKKLNEFLIQKAGQFVNKMNQDVYKEQLQFAEKEVQKNAARYEQAAKNLSTYQKSQKIISAEQEATSASKVIGLLESKLAEKKVELAIARESFVSDTAPEIKSLESAVAGLETQISNERRSRVQSDGLNLPDEAFALAKLQARLKFNGELYKSSLALAEKLRVDSLQRQRFLSVITEPSLPETPWNYWRHKGFLTALGVLLVMYCLVNFTLRMADSHRN